MRNEMAVGNWNIVQKTIILTGPSLTISFGYHMKRITPSVQLFLFAPFLEVHYSHITISQVLNDVRVHVSVDLLWRYDAELFVEPLLWTMLVLEVLKKKPFDDSTEFVVMRFDKCKFFNMTLFTEHGILWYEYSSVGWRPCTSVSRLFCLRKSAPSAGHLTSAIMSSVERTVSDFDYGAPRTLRWVCAVEPFAADKRIPMQTWNNWCMCSYVYEEISFRYFIEQK